MAIATVLTLLLAAIGGLHAYWGSGGRWPAASEDELIATVIGNARARRMPSPGLCRVVALAIALAAIWPLLLTMQTGTAAIRPFILLAGVAIMAVFLLRGIAGYLPAWQRLHPREPFASNDRRYYSPLCLLVAAGYVILLLQGP
ncbi:conserved membrane hypothetical protein [Bosea sp. 62]|uniref:DUF3995 domain-containing protein n=1 Tax=unclassified Bosea (in: a-proteobacteria) TaxID=2653178 RepID=UPI00125BAD93|nr:MULTISPECIES: DUF3995 domain-containing protein [unclassified Bosea (in: a-proteobacteria)]CAD5300272.1 conserved membrane hypothetical protein [Bosea sp. 21B]CAD5300791.1 conserved membrane hypothetical protein [Bosea sp. 46]VVT61973.1 conserved membrane hypothetical protein [Bosea sp. EC-HK365B]VXC74047.1 conserved membrane hypothetical protein [Bosea sp. 62]VXC92159.1 conserved membrane hypothetical protein [Bosea sp. 29B]